MLGQLLQRLHESGKLTVGEIANCWMIESGSVYPYFQGRWPTVDRLIDLVRYCRRSGKTDVALELGAMLFHGCGMMLTPIDADADVNGDGVVDERDVLRQVQHHCEAFGRFTADALHAIDDHRVTENERDLGDAQIDQLHVDLETTRAVFHAAAARNARRRIDNHRRQAKDGNLFDSAVGRNGKAVGR